MASSVASSEAFSMMTENFIVQTWSHKRRRTLPELLANRQTFGKSTVSTKDRSIGRGVPLDYLASRGPWATKRLQNMILAVGPGTPASVLMNPRSSASSSSSSSSYLEASDEELQEEQGGQGTEEASMNNVHMDNQESGGERNENEAQTSRSRWQRQNRPEEERSNDDDDESAPDSEQFVEDTLFEWNAATETSDDENNGTRSTTAVPSMRHGGCINTAAWLDCGWRVSAAGSSSEAICSEECPTQLVTSGDDYLVKVWDVRHAMGMTSPFPGGYSSLCPFSNPDCLDEDVLRKRWENQYKNNQSEEIAGSVIPLATLSTGHHGNVFHVTPLRGKPGQIATCGADGYVRLCNLETGDASVVVSPEFDDDLEGILPTGFLSLRPGMCYSHHFLDQNHGLVCCERGLRRFDLRLSPREQSSRSLLGGAFRACKACAIWSSSMSSSSLEESDSAYVFAGGSSAEVILCDLRMADGSSSRIVQKYCPKELTMADGVSVSGLDLSRDRQELLVSYESDQIYTFPVFPKAQNSVGPSIDEIGSLSRSSEVGTSKSLPELACYGAHLNRFTFLKNARYAGPRDEYICTGSDSGRAWIYEKSTGAVVSFLNADYSTCNGVIPHPSLPMFITYGIDATAKLWRASLPVDRDVDDSAEGRRKCFRQTQYEMSPTIRKWNDIQKILRLLESESTNSIDILPDQVPSRKTILQRSRFARHLLSCNGTRANRLGNDLHNLPDLLQQNLSYCLRSWVEEDEKPVESDFSSLKNRISLIRLRHQADQRGLTWDPTLPWQFEDSINTGAKTSASTDLHPADFVPDYPSDWIPYDPETSNSTWDFSNYFNMEEYSDFYLERYAQFWGDIRGIKHVVNNADAMGMGDGTNTADSREPRDRVVSSSEDGASSGNEVESPAEQSVEPEKGEAANGIILKTIQLLKDAGNRATQEGDLDLAAFRYDKAIQYGAVASMSFPARSLGFANGRKELLKENGGYHLEWGPMIRVMVMSRLNLALLMLKPHFSQPEHAAEQAELALHDLDPFCLTRGKVMKGTKLDKVDRDDEPDDTYIDAMTLRAKAYFRLGSAQYELGGYCEAIASYKKSVETTKKINMKPDNLVLRRLSQAKQEKGRENKRQKKNFKFAFGNIDCNAGSSMGSGNLI